MLLPKKVQKEAFMAVAAAPGNRAYNIYGNSGPHDSQWVTSMENPQRPLKEFAHIL